MTNKKCLFILIFHVFSSVISIAQSTNPHNSEADSISKTKNLRTAASASVSGIITRNAPLTLPPSTTDSAGRYIMLLPGFSTIVAGAGFYQGLVVGKQIEVEFPRPYQIIQRNNSNQALLRISGTCDSNAVAIEVHLTPVQGGVAQTDLFQAANGTFLDSLWLAGGDYRLEVKTILRYVSSVPIYGTKRFIERVGVGEVLLLWGHSFIEGDPGFDEPALDPRVRTVVTVRNPLLPNEPSKLQNLDELPYTFKPVSVTPTDPSGGTIGPFGGRTWMWGAYGDTLARRLNVPILFYMTSYGGSNVWMNAKNIKRELFGFDWFGGQDQYWMPYRPVEAAFYKYVPITGIRGILSEHGGNDSGQQFIGTLYENLVFVINHTRTVQAKHEPLAFILSKEGVDFLNQNSSAVNEKILQVLSTVPNTYLGIDLSNPATQGPWRDNNGKGHFKGKVGLDKYLELWKTAVPNSFFSTTTPKMSLKPNQP